jgi:hypothetical protein
MALPKKCVRTIHNRLKIIQEVENNPGENHVDIAKRLGLPAGTLNSIFTKKNEIRERTNTVFRINRFPIFIVCFPHSLEK